MFVQLIFSMNASIYVSAAAPRSGAIRVLVHVERQDRRSAGDRVGMIGHPLIHRLPIAM
jgi:hypothetical protein